MAAPRPTSARADVGAELRAAREARGLTLQQVADVTRISSRALDALEHNDQSRLPGGIFSRSFVRSYATHLGLDPDEMVKRFLQQFPEALPSDDQAMAAWQAHQAAQTRPPSTSLMQRVAALAAVVVLGTVVWYAWPSLVGWSTASPDEPAATASAPTVTASAPSAPSPSPDPPAPAVSVSTTSATETSGPLPTPVESAAPSPAPTAPPPAGDANGAPPPDPALVGPAAAVPVPAAAVPDSLEVVIQPVATCWVRLMVDGEFAFARVLRPGEREVRKASEQIVFDIGDASAFRFSINGVPGRVLGRKGQVVTARISRENVASYLSQ